MYELPKLPYAYDAFEPFIGAKTMEIHHTKHHATYVAKLNEALANYSEFKDKPIRDLLIGLQNAPDALKLQSETMVAATSIIRCSGS